MTMQKLKSTTAVILSFALATPHIVTAQTIGATNDVSVAANLKVAQADTDANDDNGKDKKKKRKKNKDKAEAEAALEAEVDPETGLAVEAEVEAETDAQAAADEAVKKNKKKARKAAKAAEAEAEAQADSAAVTAEEIEAELEKDSKKKKKNKNKDAAKAEVEAETQAEGEAEVQATTEADGTVVVDEDMTKKEKRKAKRKEKRKERREAREMEAVQEDTEASTEAANATPEVAATLDGEADAKVKKRREKITKKNRRASNQERAEAAAVSNDDDGLNNLEKFLIGAAGVGILTAVLNNNDKVVETEGDRVVVERGDGDYYVLKDDNALLRQPGSTVETETFSDGSSRQTIVMADGTQVVTVRAPNGQVLSRTQYLPNGQTVQLFDDTTAETPVRVSELPRVEQFSYASNGMSEADLRAALSANSSQELDRTFSLQQIRQIRAVRELMPVIELSAITFNTGSAIIEADQARALATVGTAIAERIAENPSEVFLIEGHTDAVGSATSNLALSDRRAESVALALTEYFNVPAQNLVVQGYGESNLRIPTDAAEEANRRAAVRRITPLLKSSTSG
ncbi:OmpA family protein [Neptunicoccus sediminis]|uniref:OmpA family protein n=1 Tax=Neptunicoccus sediminis TaxID=1892596 RepID=UPI0008462144|nr:OmpA family protein [Neptunicoccus sediminis]